MLSEGLSDIISAVGPIESIVELETTDGVETLKEFLPLMKEEAGKSVCSEGEYTIDPGWVRLFRVRIKDAQTIELEQIPKSSTKSVMESDMSLCRPTQRPPSAPFWIIRRYSITSTVS